jgi:regulator of sigma D
MTEKNIVLTLISQHRVLQKELGGVAEELKMENPSGNKIKKLLDIFAKDLMAHLELENNTFYKELLKKMKEKGQDTTKTEQFIGEMDEIGEKVLKFLENYKEEAVIEKEIKEFQSNFEGIVDILVLRIESEEAGVYSYWGLF